MPTIDIFVTSILSNPQLRGRHERVRRALASARAPYAEHDVAGDENAKSFWKRKNGGKNELPFILVDGEPVGNIDDMDEAVEFGELRQFLRLDAPLPPNPSNSAGPPSVTETVSPPTLPSTDTTKTPPPPPKPSLDDFADLDLTEAELAELAREISNDDTFSSGLVNSGGRDHGYDFSDATRRFEGSTAPLRIEKINFSRALPDRPLASEVARDELEGIEQGDFDLDELEQLARELEAEELERRRLRDAQVANGTRGVDPPPLPAKEATVILSVEAVTLPKEVAESRTVEGMGGASLSAPLAEIEKLEISTSSPKLADPESKTLTIESPIKEEPARTPQFRDDPFESETSDPSPPPTGSSSSNPLSATTKSLFSSVSEVFNPSSSSATPSETHGLPLSSPRKKSTPTEVEHLKESLEGSREGSDSSLGTREKAMPSFGVKDMDPYENDRHEEEEGRDGTAPRRTDRGETGREEEEEPSPRAFTARSNVHLED